MHQITQFKRFSWGNMTPNPLANAWLRPARQKVAPPPLGKSCIYTRPWTTIAEHWRTHFYGILNANILVCDQTLKSSILGTLDDIDDI